MSNSAMINKFIAPGLVLGALGLAATPAAAVDLATKAFDMTMPDGSTVTMWGFVLDDPGDGLCYDLGAAPARRNCVDDLPDPTVPGPRLVVSDSPGDITIRLTNTLPEPVSIVISGQEMPASTSCDTPVWTDGSDGDRTAPDQRVRSFGCEAAADGGRMDYRWQIADANEFQVGTHVYHSGTHPQVQVQMGLYGAIRRDVVTDAEAYPGITFDMQRDIFYSEVDPAVHAAVAGSTFTGSTLDYNPQHFLLQRYVDDTTVVDASIDPGTIPPVCIPTGGLVTGQSMLLRLYNAALRELAPMMIGSRFDAVADGGNPHQFARNQYSALLAPMGTRDLLWTPRDGGTFPLIERGLSLTDPGSTGTVSGGMQTCLMAAASGGPNDPPIADANGPYSGVAGLPIAFDGSGSSDPEGDPLSYTWDFGDSSGGTGVTPSHAYATADSFPVTVTVDDGNNPAVTSTATSAVVTANLSPTAEANGPYAGRAIGISPSQTVLPITFDGSGSSDPEGQAISYSWDFGDSNGGAGIAPAHTYAAVGTYSVTLTVDDGVSTPATDTATATVSQNAQPVAVVSAPSPSVSATVTIDGCSSSDGDGDPLAYTWDFSDGSGIQVTTDPTCSVVHSFPTVTADTTYTVTLVVNDSYEDSAAATTDVTILGTADNDAPVATGNAFNPNEISGTAAIGAPGVLDGDTDDGNPSPPGALTAQLVPGSADEQLKNLSVSPGGSFTYTPGEKVGVFSFDYRAFDGELYSAPATVDVTREIWVDKVEFKASNGEWNIKGKSSNTGGTVTIYLGPTATGTPLTTFTVAGNTRWGGKVRGLAVPGTASSISVDDTSTTDGGAVLNEPITLK